MSKLISAVAATWVAVNLYCEEESFTIFIAFRLSFISCNQRPAFAKACFLLSRVWLVLVNIKGAGNCMLPAVFLKESSLLFGLCAVIKKGLKRKRIINSFMTGC